MSYDFIGQTFTNNILKHIEAFIQKCSLQMVQNLEKQSKSTKYKSRTASLHNSFLQNALFC